MNLVLFSLALIIFKVMSVFCTVSSALCVCVCVCVCDMTCLGGCPLTSDQADICVCVFPVLDVRRMFQLSPVVSVLQ